MQQGEESEATEGWRGQESKVACGGGTRAVGGAAAAGVRGWRARVCERAEELPQEGSGYRVLQTEGGQGRVRGGDEVMRDGQGSHPRPLTDEKQEKLSSVIMIQLVNCSLGLGAFMLLHRRPTTRADRGGPTRDHCVTQATRGNVQRGNPFLRPMLANYALFA